MAWVVPDISPVLFAENAPDLVISGVDKPIYVYVTLGSKPIVSNMELIPDSNGNVLIDIPQMVRNISPISRPASIQSVLPELNLLLKQESLSRIIRSVILFGGVAGHAQIDVEDFLASNFLTWQPQIIQTTTSMPQWLAMLRPPTTVSFNLRSKLYGDDGRVLSKLLQPLQASRFTQVDTSFRAVWGAECEKNEVVPVAYDVYVEVRKTSNKTETVNQSFIQRYELREPRYGEIFFGFVNSLGGFDTIAMQGQTILKPEGEVETFTNRGVEQEIFNAYTSNWEVSSGYLASERTAAQYQDFLKSTQRYVFIDGVWLRIVVDEYDVKHTTGQVNAYTFRYHYAKRNEGRFFARTSLPEPQLPKNYFSHEYRKKMQP